MSRSLYGGSPADVTTDGHGRVIPNAQVTVWTARVGGTRVLDLQNMSGSAVTTVVSDANGAVLFYGPANTDATLWLDSGVGPRLLTRPVQSPRTNIVIGSVTTGTPAAASVGPVNESTGDQTLNLVLPPVAPNSIGQAEIEANAIGRSELQDNAVGADEIANDAIVARHVADGALPVAKISGLATVATSGVYTDLTGRPTLGGAAALDVGTTAGTVAAGNDARLSDQRVPTDGSVTDAKVSPTANIHPSKIDTARVTFSDTNFTVPATARQVDCLAITAPRTVTLPAASSVPAGTEIMIADVSGSLSDTVTLTIARAGSDTINGATTEVMRSARSYRRVRSNGVNGWAFDSGLLRAGRNLADVASPATARANLGAANAATLGNLLTENQATGTSALGTTAGFRAAGGAPVLESSTEQALTSGRSLKLTAGTTTTQLVQLLAAPAVTTATGAVPVSPGRVYTVLWSLRSTEAETWQAEIAWYTAAGALISTSASAASAATDAWVGRTVTAVAPDTAAFAVAQARRTGTWSAGSVTYFDAFSLHEGAGGRWSRPGVPVPNLGLRVSPSNSAVMQAWNDATNSWVDLASGSGVVFGTTAGTATEGNDSRVVNAVPNTRQVATGSGLTGGGDLSADRTLAVDFTAVATAAQGTKADSAVQPTIVDAKGDLLVGTADNTVARLPVGATNGHVLTVDSAEAGGMKWAAPAEQLLPSYVEIQGSTPTMAESGAIEVNTGSAVYSFTRRRLLNQNAYVEYEVILRAGTYRLFFNYSILLTGTIATFTLDGNAFTTVDTYGSPETVNGFATVTGLTVPGGRHTLRVASNTRNASNAAGWNLHYSAIHLVRTGA